MLETLQAYETGIEIHDPSDKIHFEGPCLLIVEPRDMGSRLVVRKMQSESDCRDYDAYALQVNAGSLERAKYMGELIAPLGFWIHNRVLDRYLNTLDKCVTTASKAKDTV